MIAILEAQRAGLLSRAQWLPNIVAGVIVGIVALPLAMAFAIASGARPEQGLYTAILGGACVALVEVAEFVVWSNDRRRARLHPNPYAGLADDEVSPIELDDTENRNRFN